MLGLDEALHAVIDSAAFLGAEAVPLALAAGRVLAEPVAADGDIPPFDTTAMDGWAVRAADALEGAVLPGDGTVAAGAEPRAPLAPGRALKVMTGAPIPSGCDAVVPVEDTEEADGSVRILRAPRAGAHLRKRGEIVARGELLLSRGRRLSPADLAVAASAGRAALLVARRARAGVLVTGDEIVSPDTVPSGAQIRNTNGPLLLGALGAAGAGAVDLGVAGDREAELRAALSSALDAGLDLLLTTGGVSMGDYDLLPGVLARLGAEVVFHKIALRPAKPLLFARRGATLVFGLPGNPVSAAVAFEMFVRTALRAASGLVPAEPERLVACLESRVENRGARLALLPGVLRFDRDRLLARALATKGSHDLLTHARANALLRVPPETSLAPGVEVDVYPMAEAGRG